MSSANIVPRAIRLLTKHGKEALQSSVVDGRYRAPMISARSAAQLRKRALVEGTYGQFIPNLGGWDASWDEERKVYMLNAPRGHVHERDRADRAKKIDVALLGAEERARKLQAEVAERRPKKDLFYKFKKAAEKAKKH